MSAVQGEGNVAVQLSVVICDKYGCMFFIEMLRNKVQISSVLHNTTL